MRRPGRAPAQAPTAQKAQIVYRAGWGSPNRLAQKLREGMIAGRQRRGIREARAKMFLSIR